jgi:phosphomannomutase
LKALVAENDCELGIGFDGDGDRIGVIDRLGNVMWGDQLLVMLSRDVLADHPGAPILCDVKASRVFFDEIRKMGGEPIMWKAGHSHIKSKMAELNSPLAGEMSAHIFFKHRYYGYDDAIYTAVRLLSVIAASDVSFTEMLAALPVMYNTPEIRFDCDDARKFDVVDEITERARQLAGVKHPADAGGALRVRYRRRPGPAARRRAGRTVTLGYRSTGYLIHRFHVPCACGTG